MFQASLHLHETDLTHVSQSFQSDDGLRPYAARTRDSVTDAVSSNVAEANHRFKGASPNVSIR